MKTETKESITMTTTPKRNVPMTNKEIATILIEELEETKREDYFTGRFLDIVESLLDPNFKSFI